jgi:TrmH RNA methyltransferase
MPHRAVRRGRAERQEAREPPPHQRRLLRICGLAAVLALFERAPERVERLFFEPRLGPDLDACCRLLGAARKPYRAADRATLARIGGTVRHGGVVAVARPQPLGSFGRGEPSRWARSGKPILVLDGVGNPHNLGAIARTAAFFGLERLVLADRPEQALPSDSSYRVAAGGFEQLRLYRAPMPSALDELRQGYAIVGTAPGGSQAPPARRGGRPAALVFGNEEHGLDAATRAACETIAAVPGSGAVESLNVAAAAAILLYLVTR